MEEQKGAWPCTHRVCFRVFAWMFICAVVHVCTCAFLRVRLNEGEEGGLPLEDEVDDEPADSVGDEHNVRDNKLPDMKLHNCRAGQRMLATGMPTQ